MEIELIGIAAASTGQPGGIADAIGVLRGLGLADQLATVVAVHDAGDLATGLHGADRGRSGLRNEPGLVALVDGVRAAVGAALARGRLPLLVGGDCPVLLGAVAAIRDRHGRCGLLMVDGHQDAWPPHQSPTGEASDSELGIALGMVGDQLPSRLAGLLPLLHAEAVTLLGPRDADELAAAGVASLAGTIALHPEAAVHAADPAALTASSLDRLGQVSPAWWLHVDLDALRTQDFPAVDYPQPGGLTWQELSQITTTALHRPGCAGWSIAIYNPDLDPDRTSAHRLLDYLTRALTDLADPARPGHDLQPHRV